jgi:hypothetical protein
MPSVIQTRYTGNQSDHHLSEKNADDACFNTSTATKLKAIVSVSPNNPRQNILFFVRCFIFLCALMLSNDPKLSHGANNCKREFASKCKMKEQPPLAPARC